MAKMSLRTIGPPPQNFTFFIAIKHNWKVKVVPFAIEVVDVFPTVVVVIVGDRGSHMDPHIDFA